MKELFVSYKVALKLKEKGFDEPCLRYYDHKQKLWSGIDAGTSNSDAKLALPNGVVTAPLYQQVVKWLYEQHDMFICMEPWDGDGKWRIMKNFGSKVIKEGVAMFIYADGEFGAYNVAIEEAINFI